MRLRGQSWLLLLAQYWVGKMLHLTSEYKVLWVSMTYNQVLRASPAIMYTHETLYKFETTYELRKKEQ
jgi:hypothetical protein